MNYKDVISSMKCQTFEEAWQKKLYIYNADKEKIGYFVPVGEWIENDKQKINLIRSWREKSRSMFLTHINSTFDKTLNYLKNFSIRQKGRIFFLIYDYKSKKLIGHMGMADANRKSAELDNIVRGERGGDVRLIYYAEITLLDWSFKNLKIGTINGRVLSYNSIMLSLHKKVGFLINAYKHLFAYEKDGDTFHEVVNKKKSNVTYKMIEVTLCKKGFYKKIKWL